MTFSRRNLIAMLGAAGATASMSELGAEAVGGRIGDFDPTDPLHNSHAYAKMEGSLDGAMNYHLSVGYILGFMPGRLPQLLTGFQNIKVNRIEDLGDGSYLDTYSSVYTFTVPDKSEQLPGDWTNPYTGATNRPFHYRSGPSRLLITPEGLKSPGRPEAPGKPNPFVLPWLVLGDQIVRRLNSASWFPSDLSPAEWPLESPGQEMISAHFTSRVGDLADLVNPDIARMDVTSFTNSQSNWLPWMLMGQIPGHIGYHTIGRSFARLGDVPEESIRLAEQVVPDFFDAPLDLPYTLQLREFKKARKPAQP